MITIVMLAALTFGQVDNLDDYGLSNLAVMTDVEGEEIRGKAFFSRYYFSGWNVSGTSGGFNTGGSSSISGFGTVSGFSTGGGEISDIR